MILDALHERRYGRRATFFGSSLDLTTKRANGIVMKDVLQFFAIGDHLFEKFLQSRAETDSLEISSLPVAARAIATEEQLFGMALKEPGRKITVAR